MRYYDLKRNWNRVASHLSHPAVADALVTDFNKFTFGRWQKPFLPGMVPHTFESCDWFLGHRGPMPRFWQYTKHAACHWLVNFALELAMQVLPDRPWRILTSERHSTVWDGKDTLFDFNMLAMGVAADECYALAITDGETLGVGEHLQVNFSAPWYKDLGTLTGAFYTPLPTTPAAKRNH